MGSFVEQTIHDIRERKIREAEMRRLAAIEAEKRRKQEELENILVKVEQINERCRSLYSKELSAAKLGEELLTSATEYISHKVDLMSQTLVPLPVGDINSVKSQFGEAQFKIIDRVPCQLDEQNFLLHVSNKFIKNCIEGKNFIAPVCSIVRYEEATRSLILGAAESSGGGVQPYSQHHGLSAGRLDGLADPLNKATELLVMAKDIDAKMKGDVAKISVLSIYSEVSSFKDLMKSIDTVLADISENVKLIAWNNSNSKHGGDA